MGWRGTSGGRAVVAVLAALVVGLAGCAGTRAPSASGQADDLASLQQRVAAQDIRIAALETRVGLAQQALTPRPAAPTATVVPAVAGLVVDGNTKGPATAKVTITEYVDYL